MPSLTIQIVQAFQNITPTVNKLPKISWKNHTGQCLQIVVTIAQKTLFLCEFEIVHSKFNVIHFRRKTVEKALTIIY